MSHSLIYARCCFTRATSTNTARPDITRLWRCTNFRTLEKWLFSFCAYSIYKQTRYQIEMKLTLAVAALMNITSYFAYRLLVLAISPIVVPTHLCRDPLGGLLVDVRVLSHNVLILIASSYRSCSLNFYCLSFTDIMLLLIQGPSTAIRGE